MSIDNRDSNSVSYLTGIPIRSQYLTEPLKVYNQDVATFEARTDRVWFKVALTNGERWHTVAEFFQMVKGLKFTYNLSCGYNNTEYIVRDASGDRPAYSTSYTRDKSSWSCVGDYTFNVGVGYTTIEEWEPESIPSQNRGCSLSFDKLDNTVTYGTTSTSGKSGSAIYDTDDGWSMVYSQEYDESGQSTVSAVSIDSKVEPYLLHGQPDYMYIVVNSFVFEYLTCGNIDTSYSVKRPTAVGIFADNHSWTNSGEDKGSVDLGLGENVVSTNARLHVVGDFEDTDTSAGGTQSGEKGVYTTAFTLTCEFEYFNDVEPDPEP
jgi:hypothetical protein